MTRRKQKTCPKCRSLFWVMYPKQWRCAKCTAAWKREQAAEREYAGQMETYLKGPDPRWPKPLTPIRPPTRFNPGKATSARPDDESGRADAVDKGDSNNSLLIDGEKHRISEVKT